jgi:hypothetical protein
MMPSWITQTPETGVTADSFLKSVVVSVYFYAFFISPTFVYLKKTRPAGGKTAPRYFF